MYRSPNPYPLFGLSQAALRMDPGWRAWIIRAYARDLHSRATTARGLRTALARYWEATDGWYYPVWKRGRHLTRRFE